MFCFTKLNPEFKLRYAIYSREHPHLMAISYMRRRKFTSTTQVRNHKIMHEILSKLITLTPYIKGSDCPYRLIDDLEQKFGKSLSIFDPYAVEDSVHFLFDSVLYLWEPQFHPLIREELKDLLLWIIGQLTKAKEFEQFKYAMAEAQLHMHEEYDHYLGSGKLDGYIYESMSLEGIFYEKDIDSWAVPDQFLHLDRDLIKLSLKRRAAIVQLDHQVLTYLSGLRGLLEDDLRKERLTNLLNELEVCGFFDINNRSINWEKRCFTELIDKVSNEVFAEHSLPRHYVIRGIIDYRTIALYRDKSWQSFEQVGEACNRLTAYLPQFWRDTRHYKHKFYDIVREPLEKVFI
ncbi:uncharacterized protein LOC110435779 [Sorghum bicolor]|uniref:uncharacterized protein LOC110435779 n=1 Tax=Sorghum bicolor TaxID=4558 RepID=UPI000B423CB9|nr:uncharacterized protein LOC110435779 [Sorghum bicolor]|eukprot:XP_021317495.1 uncharacterized protein LOC110435779 [Sorghum bicolor]